MDTATLSNRTLAIDGMTGDACVQKVTAALKGVQGVTTQSVKVGEATIACDQNGCNSAKGAIGQAGFKCRESGQVSAAPAATGSTGSTAGSVVENKGTPHAASSGVAAPKPATTTA